MCIKSNMRVRGLTLVEVVVGMTILIIAVLGTMAYQCQAARQSRYARMEIAATRIGQLLLEDWKANGASVDYAPEDLQMGITRIVGEEGFAPNGDEYSVYSTTVDDIPLRIMLLRQPGYNSPIRITVSVQWDRDYGIALATYARGDEAFGSFG